MVKKEVKPRVKCECCGATKEYPEYEEFCDVCETLISKEKYPLHLQVFGVDGPNTENIDVNCCSWKCIKKYLSENKAQLSKCEFISLPYVVPNRYRTEKPYIEDFKLFYNTFIHSPTVAKEPMESKQP